MEKTAMKEIAKNGTASAKKRQSHRKIKNLEEEAKLSLSQEEDESDVVVDNYKETDETVALSPDKEDVKQTPVTPRRRATKFELVDGLQTPRRSVRKSVKPAQDYEDIVVKKTMCSLKKYEKQSSVEDDETEEGSDEKLEKSDAPKWTPAKVGRGTQKRRKRKSRKTLIKPNCVEEQMIGLEEELLIAIENDEDENKENVSPQDLLKHGKQSKDMENSKINVERNQELGNSAEKTRKSLQDTVLKPLVTELHANILEKEHVQVEDDKNIVTDNFVTELITELLDVDSAAVVSLAPVTIQESIKLLVPECSQTSEMKNLNFNEPIPVDIKDKKDATFDATSNASLNESDCIIITPEPTTEVAAESAEEAGTNISSEKEDTDCVMQSLLLSEDEDENSCPKKDELENKNSERFSPSLAKVPKLTITGDDFANVTLLQTPKQRPKPYRFPTPYKSRDVKNLSFEFNKSASDEDDAEQENLEPITIPSSNKRQVTAMTPISIMKLTKLEPREIVLRHIHKKRSLSVCSERTQNKSMNRVKFHSPANQTTFIDDLDLLITKSAIKRKVHTPVVRRQGDVAAPDTTNVTKRRKRSLSLDESVMQMQRKAQQAPPDKSKGTPPRKPQRSKIPNFAIIHQRQFNKMENLSDHLQRKADRAKILTTSTCKLRPDSAQKVGNQMVVSCAGAVGLGAIKKIIKPKAVKKINLNNVTAASGGIENYENPHFTNSPKNPNLPDPKLLLRRNLAVVKPFQLNQQKAATSSTKKPVQEKRLVTLPKPAFNLSTNVKSSAAPVLVPDKVVTRRQRHMEMFKGRTGGTALKGQENASEIIRGVRSNRRFQLQMQHRKKIEKIEELEKDDHNE